MKKFKPVKTEGFTLIELLIVIMLLGILSAAVLAVINPAKQRARAQDGILKGTMSKIGAAIDAFYVIKSRVPARGSEFLGEVSSSYSFSKNRIHGTFYMKGVQTGRSWFYYTDTTTHGIAGCLAANSREDVKQVYVKMPRKRVKNCRINVNSTYPYYACLGYVGYGGTNYATCADL